MSDRKRRLTRIGNRIGVWLYRVSKGRSPGGGKRARVLVITAPGRRTGLPRSTCVRFLGTPDGLVVWGSGSGSRRDPEWFRNLRAAKEVEVLVGPRRLRVRPRELVGEEREAIWNGVVLAQVPDVARYARRSGRTIPVAVLTELEESRLRPNVQP